MRRGLSSNALKLWESTVKYYKNSYVAWSRYLDLLMYGHRVFLGATLMIS